MSGLYRSELLDEEVSSASLSALAHTDEFRNVVGGRVEVADIAESPFHIKVTTIMDEEAGLELAQKRAVHLLSAELKELALTEVDSSLKYLDEVKQKTLELQKYRPKAVDARPRESSEKRLSEKDSSRVLLIRKEIGQLEEFLQGGSLAKAVRVKLDRDSLADAERRTRNQERELGRLMKLFHPTSKAVQAQRVSTEQARADLLSMERHLAEVYLRSLRLELETLDDKTVSLIEENAARNGAITEDDRQLAVEGSSWLAERAEELQTRADVITEASALKLDGKLTISERTSDSYPVVALCWVASLFFLLMAIFKPTRPGVDESYSPPRTSGKPSGSPSRQGSVVRLELTGLNPAVQPDVGLDRFEAFFEDICVEMQQTLGRSPRRILVLGDTPVESRLAFSIRLANSLGRQAERVRLIDFDLQSKSLSERLGREELPGVGDLLLHGGPVEEFFSSIAGTRIQFAPAGKASAIYDDIQSERVEHILGRSMMDVTVIDATSSSPLHLIVRLVDAVLCTTQYPAGMARSEREQEVLVAFRDAGLPVWGVSVDKAEFFPLL